MTARADRIVALALQGTRPAEIAAATGSPIASVYSAVTQARARGIDIPRFTPSPHGGRGRVIRVPHETFDRLEQVARDRGFRSTAALAAALLDAICDDDLFDAVLED